MKQQITDEGLDILKREHEVLSRMEGFNPMATSIIADYIAEAEKKRECPCVEIHTDTQVMLCSDPPMYQQTCKECGKVTFIKCSDYEKQQRDLKICFGKDFEKKRIQMPKSNAVYKAKDIKIWENSVEIEPGKWIPARPVVHEGFIYRFAIALKVLFGIYDALDWQDQNR